MQRLSLQQNVLLGLGSLEGKTRNEVREGVDEERHSDWSAFEYDTKINHARFSLDLLHLQQL